MDIEPLHRPQRCIRLRLAVTLVGGSALLLALLARFTGAQAPAMSRMAGDNSALHMEMSPARPGSAADTARAMAVARELRAALMKYRDTTAAVAEGYRMFMPRIRDQKVYHFTNSWRAVQEAFRFDPTRPTSILYTKTPDGVFHLAGAMYTAPKRFGLDKLDERVPLSVAHWHKHVNWCVPKRGETKRWMERAKDAPVFGPESPIATKEACDAVGGVFHPVLFGWMIHANVFAGDDAASVWGDGGREMHDGMMGDPM
jgi:hypothetical protein